MEKRKRSLVKAISWRVIATLVTILFAYIFLEDWTESIALGVGANALKALLYYLHERGWNMTDWLRTPRANSRGVTVWFTGLPGCGKSTIADALARKLEKEKAKVVRLDGDVIREHLWRDLGFSKEDRDENIRRVAFMCGLLGTGNIVTITTFISPYREMRDHARNAIGDFVEVFVKCPVEVCIERDPKGLYKKALAGEIPNFTGVSDPYEEPLNPEILVESDKEPVDKAVDRIVAKLKKLKHI